LDFFVIGTRSAQLEKTFVVQAGAERLEDACAAGSHAPPTKAAQGFQESARPLARAACAMRARLNIG
jgi:hypothetical protein